MAPLVRSRPLLGIVIQVGIVLACANCNKDTSPAPPVAESAAPAMGAQGGPAKAAVPGRKLTKAQLDEAKALAKPFADWNETYAKIAGKLGEPHGKDGDSVYWRAIDGDKCAKFSMDKMGAQVGGVGITEYDKAMKSAWEKCAGSAG